MQTTPHGWRIIDADAGVLSFTYAFGGTATANCLTARLADGGLLVVSPPSKISAEAIDELAPYGPVRAIVANNGFHHLGIARWRERFGEARCFAAPGAAARIAKKSAIAGELEPLAALTPALGDGVAVVEAPASKCGETWVRAPIADGYAWYASDILANLQALPPNFVVRLLFKWTRSAPGYRVFHLATRFIFKDKRAALRAMLEEVRRYPPTVMVPGHGEILTAPTLADDTQRVLAAALA